MEVPKNNLQFATDGECFCSQIGLADSSKIERLSGRFHFGFELSMQKDENKKNYSSGAGDWQTSK